MDKQTQTSNISVIRTIDLVVLGEIQNLVYPNETVKSLECSQPSPLIKFLPIAAAIEFLGACYDELPFKTPKASETRFKKALQELFDKKYHKYAKADSKHYLYEKFRCGMVHQLRPTGGIMLTTRREAKEDGNTHLCSGPNETIILVLEDLYDDLKAASEKLKRKFQSGKLTNKKQDKDYIRITEFKR